MRDAAIAVTGLLVCTMLTHVVFGEQLPLGQCQRRCKTVLCLANEDNRCRMWKDLDGRPTYNALTEIATIYSAETGPLCQTRRRVTVYSERCWWTCEPNRFPQEAHWAVPPPEWRLEVGVVDQYKCCNWPSA